MVRRRDSPRLLYRQTRARPPVHAARALLGSITLGLLSHHGYHESMAASKGHDYPSSLSASHLTKICSTNRVTLSPNEPNPGSHFDLPRRCMWCPARCAHFSYNGHIQVSAQIRQALVLCASDLCQIFLHTLGHSFAR